MADGSGAIAPAKLKSFIERIERLEGEKAELAEDIREVYAEAKGEGFDTKIMRQVIRLRKLEVHERREQEELLDTYRKALGM
jgi:uncharacterized protein (UPF0335 family)